MIVETCVSHDVLREVLIRLFPTASPDSILCSPFSTLDHSRRALIQGAVCAANSDLHPNAFQISSTWDDIREWLIYANPPDLLAGARVRLRPLEPRDTSTLYRAAFDPNSSFRWRYRGQTLGPAEFEASLHQGVLCQFAVCSPSGDLQGLVVSYQADLTNGHAYFGYLRATSVQPIPGATTEGLALFFRHLFKCFPLRMLYCELPSSNIHLIRSLSDAGLFQQVGRFPEHLFGPHGFEDMYTFILTRETWQTYFSGYFPDSRPPDIER